MSRNKHEVTLEDCGLADEWGSPGKTWRAYVAEDAPLELNLEGSPMSLVLTTAVVVRALQEACPFSFSLTVSARSSAEWRSGEVTVPLSVCKLRAAELGQPAIFHAVLPPMALYKLELLPDPHSTATVDTGHAIIGLFGVWSRVVGPGRPLMPGVGHSSAPSSAGCGKRGSVEDRLAIVNIGSSSAQTSGRRTGQQKQVESEDGKEECEEEEGVEEDEEEDEETEEEEEDNESEEQEAEEAAGQEEQEEEEGEEEEEEEEQEEEEEEEDEEEEDEDEEDEEGEEEEEEVEGIRGAARAVVAASHKRSRDGDAEAKLEGKKIRKDSVDSIESIYTPGAASAMGLLKTKSKKS